MMAVQIWNTSGIIYRPAIPHTTNICTCVHNIQYVTFQAARRWLLTAKTWLQFRVTSTEIHGRLSGTEAVSPKSYVAPDNHHSTTATASVPGQAAHYHTLTASPKLRV